MKKYKQNEFITKKEKSGYYGFYLRGKDVTEEWMYFFSGLDLKDEYRCAELFIKKKNKIINKLK